MNLRTTHQKPLTHGYTCHGGVRLGLWMVMFPIVNFLSYPLPVSYKIKCRHLPSLLNTPLVSLVTVLYVLYMYMYIWGFWFDQDCLLSSLPSCFMRTASAGYMTSPFWRGWRHGIEVNPPLSQPPPLSETPHQYTQVLIRTLFPFSRPLLIWALE